MSTPGILGVAASWLGDLDTVLRVLNGGMEEEEEIILDLWLSMVVSGEPLGRGSGDDGNLQAMELVKGPTVHGQNLKPRDRVMWPRGNAQQAEI